MSEREQDKKRNPEKGSDLPEDAELVKDLDVEDDENEDVRGGAHSRFGIGSYFSAEPGGVSGASR